MSNYECEIGNYVYDQLLWSLTHINIKTKNVFKIKVKKLYIQKYKLYMVLVWFLCMVAELH